MSPGKRMGKSGASESKRKPGRPRKHSPEELPERVAAYLPPALAERLRVYTVRLKPRESMSEVVAKAIEEYLDANE